MLVESLNVRQIEGEPKRRWFYDADFDLIVWYGRFGRIVEFELCYDKAGRERAIIWKSGSGYSHHQIDTGKDGIKATSVLVAAGQFDHLPVADLFQQRSAEIDQQVADFVYKKIKQYRAPNKH